MSGISSKIMAYLLALILPDLLSKCESAFVKEKMHPWKFHAHSKIK
jgi:hypothetical protein